MSNVYIQHYGIKGMKWGVRRNYTDNSTGGTYGPKPPKKRTSVEDLKSTKKIIDNTSDTINQTKKINNEINNMKSDSRKKKNQAQIKYDLDSMSDKELQQVVNRLNMEERYSSVMNSRYTDTGKNRVDTILNYSGAALAIGSSALSIALAIKELKR